MNEQDHRMPRKAEQLASLIDGHRKGWVDGGVARHNVTSVLKVRLLQCCYCWPSL